MLDYRSESKLRNWAVDVYSDIRDKGLWRVLWDCLPCYYRDEDGDWEILGPSFPTRWSGDVGGRESHSYLFSVWRPSDSNHAQIRVLCWTLREADFKPHH